MYTWTVLKFHIYSFTSTLTYYSESLLSARTLLLFLTSSGIVSNLLTVFGKLCPRRNPNFFHKHSPPLIDQLVLPICSPASSHQQFCPPFRLGFLLLSSRQRCFCLSFSSFSNKSWFWAWSMRVALDNALLWRLFITNSEISRIYL